MGEHNIIAVLFSIVGGVDALEAKQKGVGKVKCKEQVNEALRQYWDKGECNTDLEFNWTEH